MTGGIDGLAAVLFDGPVKAERLQVVPGTRVDVSADELADEILASMERTGIVRDGLLVDANRPAVPA